MCGIFFKSLAEKGAHLYPKQALNDLILISITNLESGSDSEQGLALTVIHTLTKYQGTCHTLLDEKNNFDSCICTARLENH